jgi:glucosamine-phosphate N-acetyltransferase
VIKELVQLAKNQKCYKVILDCDDANVPFYQSCGLSKKGTAMAVYFE